MACESKISVSFKNWMLEALSYELAQNFLHMLDDQKFTKCYIRSKFLLNPIIKIAGFQKETIPAYPWYILALSIIDIENDSETDLNWLLSEVEKLATVIKLPQDEVKNIEKLFHTMIVLQHFHGQNIRKARRYLQHHEVLHKDELQLLLNEPNNSPPQVLEKSELWKQIAPFVQAMLKKLGIPIPYQVISMLANSKEMLDSKREFMNSAYEKYKKKKSQQLNGDTKKLETSKTNIEQDVSETIKPKEDCNLSNSKNKNKNAANNINNSLNTAMNDPKLKFKNQQTKTRRSTLKEKLSTFFNVNSNEIESKEDSTKNIDNASNEILNNDNNATDNNNIEDVNKNNDNIKDINMESDVVDNDADTVVYTESDDSSKTPQKQQEKVIENLENSDDEFKSLKKKKTLSEQHQQNETIKEWMSEYGDDDDESLISHNGKMLKEGKLKEKNVILPDPDCAVVPAPASVSDEKQCSNTEPDFEVIDKRSTTQKLSETSSRHNSPIKYTKGMINIEKNLRTKKILSPRIKLGSSIVEIANDQAGPSTPSTSVSSKESRKRKHIRIGDNSDDSGESLEWSSDEEGVRNNTKKRDRKNSITSVSGRKQRVPFTQNEEDNLRKGIKLYGVGNWAKILSKYKFDSSRTSVSLKDKYRNLKRSNNI